MDTNVPIAPRKSKDSSGKVEWKEGLIFYPLCMCVIDYVCYVVLCIVFFILYFTE